MNFVDLSVKCGKTEYKEKEILSPYSRKDGPKIHPSILQHGISHSKDFPPLTLSKIPSF